MKRKIENLERQLGQANTNGRKSDSFEMYNNSTLAHIKDILLKYLSKTVLSDAPNEKLLEVIFSMLHISEEEKRHISIARERISPLVTENPRSNRSSPGGREIKKRSFILSNFFSRGGE
jgi:hypothetical protein